MSQLKAVRVVVWRCVLVIAGLLVAVALALIKWMERVLLELAPAIFSALPDEYRRILLLLVGPPCKCERCLKLENAA